MEKIAKIARFISDKLETGLNWAVIFCTGAMLMVVLAGIISRAGFNAAFPWSEELGRYTMIYAGCLGIGLALKRGLHVGIALMVKKLSPNVALVCDIAGRILITIFLVEMIIQGISVCEFVSMRTSPTMGFNMVWVFIITPVTAILQLIFLGLMTIEDIAAGGIQGKSLVLRDHNIDF
ncbi:MAG: TRAP transporter small permease [Desulfobacula sp.]|jgi:TRAP-type C4-dicarboxylate transport system permease small subunit|nr:TRAP transporter small permease [Desulfobacula sp.]